MKCGSFMYKEDDGIWLPHSPRRLLPQLLDQEYIGVPWDYNISTNTYTRTASAAYIAAVNWGNDAVYNATVEVWPGVDIDQYKRGEVRPPFLLLGVLRLEEISQA